jgi:hypothetical protein
MVQSKGDGLWAKWHSGRSQSLRSRTIPTISSCSELHFTGSCQDVHRGREYPQQATRTLHLLPYALWPQPFSFVLPAQHFLQSIRPCCCTMPLGWLHLCPSSHSHLISYLVVSLPHFLQGQSLARSRLQAIKKARWSGKGWQSGHYY